MGASARPCCAQPETTRTATTARGGSALRSAHPGARAVARCKQPQRTSPYRSPFLCGVAEPAVFWALSFLRLASATKPPGEDAFDVSFLGVAPSPLLFEKLFIDLPVFGVPAAGEVNAGVAVSGSTPDGLRGVGAFMTAGERAAPSGLPNAP